MLRHPAAGSAACVLVFLFGCALEHAPSSTAVESDVEGRHVLLVDPAEPGLRAAVEALGATVETWHGGTGIATVRGLDDSTARTASVLPGVRGIGPDVVVRLLPEAGADPEVAITSTLGVRGEPGAAPHLARQWHLRAIGADRAWAAGREGSPRITVAVLDTGLDYGHPDLTGRVDLSRSVSFVPADDALVDELFVGRHPVTDLHLHGTHVGATISSNAVAAAGVTSEVTLIGVKVLGVDGTGAMSGILRGILHATDTGADVINMSLGGTLRRRGLDWYLGLLHVAFQHAVSRGATIVVAAGNDGRDLDADVGLFDLFCEAELAVCVSATGPLSSSGDFGPYEEVDAPAPYSNHGSGVDVSAPGGAAEPVWAACSSTSLLIPDCAKHGTIAGLSGTSMAAPHVSGLAALLVEDHGRRPAHVRRMMERLSTDLGVAGRDPHHGWGRIDVPRSVGLDAVTRTLSRP